MTREERCQLAIEKGFKYNSESGEIFGVRGNKINGKHQNYVLFHVYNHKKPYKVLGHQFAWFYVYGKCVKEIDHINQIRDDNRICNLRSVTHQENNWNIKAKGCYYVKKTNNWRAKISLNGKYLYLGTFKTQEEAREKYLKAKVELHKIT